MTFEIGGEAPSVQSGKFTVPNECTHLSLTYDLSGEFTFLVFLMLKSPAGKIRFLKQLSYSEPVISLGESAEDTTIGGIPEKIYAGEWEVKIFLFAEHIKRLMGEKKLSFHVTVSDTKQEITEAIGGEIWAEEDFIYNNYDFDKVFQKKTGWFKGDLHTHTKLSDGKELPFEAMEKAKLMNLDYYIPTEHNDIHSGWPQTDVMVVPGIEITTILGHANLFGIDKMPRAIEKILSDKEEAQLAEAVEDVIRECKERHWLFSVNHPFLHIWKWLYDDLSLSDIDSLEIINDPTYQADKEAKAKEANEKSVLLSDLLWADGYRICAIGGSDSHNKIDEFYEGANEPSIAGDPATWLFAENLTPKNLLKAVKDCHSYVTRHCEIDTTLLFGSRLDENETEIPYRLCMKNLKAEEIPQIFYLHNGKKQSCEVTVSENGEYIAEGTVNLTDESYQWIRFGAETKNGDFLFYGNPITKGTKEHTFYKFGEIKEYLESIWK